MTRREAISRLRGELVNRRAIIHAALKGDLTALSGVSACGNLADSALGAANEEMASQLAEVESDELQQIDLALGRFASGDFGDCKDCLDPIPIARLEAIPSASLCIDCQIKSEKSTNNCWPQRTQGAYDSQ